MTAASWTDLTMSSRFDTGFVPEFNNRTKNLLKQDFSADTSIPSGAIRINPTTGVLEKFNGTAWATFQRCLANDSYLLARNAAGSGYLNLIKAGSDDSTSIESAASTGIVLRPGGADKWYAGHTGTLRPVNNSSQDIGSSSYYVQSLFVSKGLSFPVTNVTALGSGQGGAAALSTGINIVTADTTSLGVRLPSATVGMWVIVNDSGSANNSFSIYPASGEYIQWKLQNVADASVVGAAAMYICHTSGRWTCIQGAIA